MSTTLQYHSSQDTKSRKKKRKKPEISQLAQDSFNALTPFINVFDCGISYDGSPIHLINKEAWRLYRRHKAGEKEVAFPDGTKFNPYLRVIQNIYGPQHVQRHIHRQETSYYTSGRKGLGLLYLDIDAHDPWQTDELRAKAVLERMFPFGYYRPSNRGQNGYLKVSYTSIQEFNRIAGVLQGILKRLFLHLGVFCDVEVKGTITVGDKSGSLAKLPFATRDSRHMRDETDTWDYPQLRRFVACPMVNARRIEYLARQVASSIDDEKVRAFAEQKKAIRKKANQDLVEMAARAYAENTIASLPNRNEIELELPIACPSCGSHKFGIGMYRYLCSKCGHSLEPHVVSGIQIPTALSRSAPPPPAQAQEASEQERGIRPIRAHLTASRLASNSDDLNPDAFRRNHADIKPFVRAFFKRFRMYPSTEETLDWLKANHRYSGQWEENEAKRAKRVRQILAFTKRTFDPSKLSSGDKEVHLSRGRYAWWVRQHFGSEMTVHITDHRRIDPETLTAPIAKVHVPAEFVETFLAVAQFCLKQDPLTNMAVPTNRIKKLWSMVEGGAAWNQQYYQIVRDRLDRMGVIRITDRHHAPGRAWRWEAGQEFPEATWKREQRKVSTKLLCGDGGEQDIGSREKEIHNTLYKNAQDTPSLQSQNLLVRPPP